MKSPKEKYENDPNYKRMVDSMTAMINQCHFTPAEMREMAILASIHHEMNYVFRNHSYTVPSYVNDALNDMDRFRKEEAEKHEKRKQEKLKNGK